MLFKDVGFAARRLVRSPTFTLASVLTLALAIGTNAAIFAVVRRVVVHPVPYPDSDRLIVLDIESMLYGVTARDPGIFAATTLTVLSVALLACALPAVRAARLSPLEALRRD